MGMILLWIGMLFAGLGGIALLVLGALLVLRKLNSN
jgi:hypothetical protein